MHNFFLFFFFFFFLFQSLIFFSLKFWCGSDLTHVSCHFPLSSCKFPT